MVDFYSFVLGETRHTRRGEKGGAGFSFVAEPAGGQTVEGADGKRHEQQGEGAAEDYYTALTNYYRERSGAISDVAREQGAWRRSQMQAMEAERVLMERYIEDTFYTEEAEALA